MAGPPAPPLQRPRTAEPVTATICRSSKPSSPSPRSGIAAVHGRCFFEEVIRENIDLGRPEQVQLIFARKMQRKTATDGRCRTRIITEGVVPSLHVY